MNRWEKLSNSKQRKRNEIKEYTLKYLKWSTFFVSPSYLWTKDILDGILYKNCLVFPEEQTSRLVKEAKAPGHGRSQKSLGWLWWRRGLPESRGGCGKGWKAGVDIQYMEYSTVQDNLQALVQKSVCRKWRRWRGEKEEQSRVKSHLCIWGVGVKTNLFLHNKKFLAFLWCLE